MTHTLVIQGPYHPFTASTVFANFENFSQIIISSWLEDEDNFSDLQAQFSGTDERIQILFSEGSKLDASMAPDFLKAQVVTTCAALRRTKTTFVTKVRSDEFYDLTQWVKHAVFNPESRELPIKSGFILFSNFIVRPWNYHKFHISDHLFGGRTQVIAEALEALDKGELLTAEDTLNALDRTCPESIIGRQLFLTIEHSYSLVLKTAALTNPRQREWKLFTKYFRLFDLEDLKSFVVRARRAEVSNVTSLKTLGSWFSRQGLNLDFVYVKRLSALRPQPSWLHRATSFCRYFTRRLFGRPMPPAKAPAANLNSKK
jgi:hypothetical protein